MNVKTSSEQPVHQSDSDGPSLRGLLQLAPSSTPNGAAHVPRSFLPHSDSAVAVRDQGTDYAKISPEGVPSRPLTATEIRSPLLPPLSSTGHGQFCRTPDQRPLAQPQAPGARGPWQITEATTFLTQQHRWVEAEPLLRIALHQDPANRDLHSQFIRTLGALKDFDGMERHLRALVFSGGRVGVRHFNHAINACVTASLFDRAIGIFDLMGFCQTKADAITYNGVSFACKKTGQYDRAWVLFKAMRAGGFGEAPLPLQNLLGAFCKAQQADRAREVYLSIRHTRAQPSSLCYDRLIATFGNNERPQWAWEVFEDMRELGVSCSIKTLEKVIAIAANAGKLDRASMAFETMLNSMVEAQRKAYIASLEGFVRAGEIEQAWQMCDAMVTEGVADNVAAYNACIEAIGQVNDFGLAWATYGRMQTNGINCNTDTLRHLMQTAAGPQQRDLVLTAFRAMQVLGGDIDSSVLLERQEESRRTTSFASYRNTF